MGVSDHIRTDADRYRPQLSESHASSHINGRRAYSDGLNGSSMRMKDGPRGIANAVGDELNGVPERFKRYIPMRERRRMAAAKAAAAGAEEKARNIADTLSMLDDDASADPEDKFGEVAKDASVWIMKSPYRAARNTRERAKQQAKRHAEHQARQQERQARQTAKKASSRPARQVGKKTASTTSKTAVKNAPKQAVNTSKATTKAASQAVQRARAASMATRKTVATTAKAGAQAGRAIAAAVAKVVEAIGAAISAVGPYILLAIVLIGLVAGLVFGLTTCSKASEDSYADTSVGSLEGSDAEVAAILMENGYSKTATAAILGVWHCEGYDPTGLEGIFGEEYTFGPKKQAANKDLDHYTRYVLLPQYRSYSNFYFSAPDGKAYPGLGLAQWTGERAYYFLQYTKQKKLNWYTLEANLGYFISETSPGGLYSEIGSERFKKQDNLESAVYEFVKVYEHAGIAENYSDMSKRYNAAKEVLNSLNSPSAISGNIDFTTAEMKASSAQAKAIARSCTTTPTTNQGRCAEWVSNVYQNAGYERPGGNANDMWAAYCTSNNPKQLKVGMIVAVQHSGPTGDSWMYGHVGIYVGNGMVMHSTGTVQTNTLEEWRASFDPYGTIRWGYPSWVKG